MTTLINISLLTYLILVAIIGTLGNGVILLAYGNRWNSSTSTSVVFILVLACIDLWTCLIVVPTIAIMEYRNFDVPTPICRFYSFSKNLIIISSFIMSFIAFDRFLNIAMPHCRLLNPRRVKVLLTLLISIGIGLGTLTALAFSALPLKNIYLANYILTLGNDTHIQTIHEKEVGLSAESNTSLSADIIEQVTEELSIPDGANITILNLEYRSTQSQCFADTSIISETMREILKHVSNKVFFTLIGIVTIFYTITFLLALRRQNPRIRALKKSLNVLSKFDAYPPAKSNQISMDLTSTVHSPSMTRSVSSAKQTIITLNENHSSNGERLSKSTSVKSHPTKTDQQYEMSKFPVNDDSDDQNLPSPHVLRKSSKHKSKSRSLEKHNISLSDGTSDDLNPSTEKFNSPKQVSFQIDKRRSTITNEQIPHLSISTVSFDGDLDGNDDTYYKLPCPCWNTRQLLIKFHFVRPSLAANKWLCCWIKKQSPISHHISIASQTEDETATILTPTVPSNHSSSSHSETLRKQLHQHRIRQLRMASTFLLITVSFVLFYLPSILNAERIIKSPIMIYYLYLCTHALNPIIYCFMNRSLRVYIVSMFNCRRKQQTRGTKKGSPSFFER